MKLGIRFHKMDITSFLEDNPRLKARFSTLYPILDNPEKTYSIMQDLMRSLQEFFARENSDTILRANNGETLWEQLASYSHRIGDALLCGSDKS